MIRRVEGSGAKAVVIGLGLIFVLQTIFLIWIGFGNAERLSVDGIHYLRTAGYYQRWESNLMVSGYQSPLLSWLLVPFLKVGLDPNTSVRVLMGLTSVAFLASTVVFLSSLRVGRRLTLLVCFCVATATLYWSVTAFLVPDVLVATLLLLALSVLFRSSWTVRPRSQFVCGILFGLAYLAKSVAFPITLLFVVGYGISMVVLERIGRRRAVLATSLTLAAFALVALPWTGVLAAKYGHFTISKVGRISHAILGPDNGSEAYHPWPYAPPDSGRFSYWEEVDSDLYEYWSPFESFANAKHQLLRIGWSGLNIVRALILFDRLGVCLLLLLGVGVLGVFRMGKERSLDWLRNRPRIWRLLLVMACLFGLYLPVFSTNYRYYYAIYPIVLLFALLSLGDLLPTRITRRRHALMAGQLLIVASFFFSAVWQDVKLWDATKTHGRYHECADLIRQNELEGPLAAGSNSIDAIFAAHLLGRPFHGMSANPTREDLRGSGATWIVDPPQSPLAERIASSPDDWKEVLVSMDSLSYANAGRGDSMPCRIFRVISPS